MYFGHIQVDTTGSRYVGRRLHARVRLTGKIEDSIAPISHRPRADTGGSLMSEDPQTHQDNIGDADGDGVAFVTYALDDNNSFTWNSQAILYLGDIAAGDWGIEGPLLHIELFDTTDANEHVGVSTVVKRKPKPVEAVTVFLKDLPAKLTADEYLDSVERMEDAQDASKGKGKGGEEFQEMVEIVSKVNDWLDADPPEADKANATKRMKSSHVVPRDTEVRIRLKAQISTHIPSYDLVLLTK